MILFCKFILQIYQNLKLTDNEKNVYDFVKGEIIIVNVDRLKSYVLEDIKWVSVDHPYDENRIIKDYIFVTYS